MSIIGMIIKHEAPDGRLHRFRPLLRGAETEVRMLSVHFDLHDWLYAEPSAVILDFKAGIRAHLGEFVKGELIDDLYFMKRVENRRKHSDVFGDGVWSFSPRFRPQYRVFGFFAITDWFVAMTQESRDVLEQSEARWQTQIDTCTGIWDSLFPGRSPWIQDRIEHYVSGNMEKIDDRW